MGWIALPPFALPPPKQICPYQILEPIHGILFCKRASAGVFQSRILRFWGVGSGWTKWALNPMTSVFMRDKLRGDTQRWGMWRQSRDRKDATDCQQPPAATGDCLRAAGGGTAWLDFGFLDSRTWRKHISVVFSLPVCSHSLAVIGNSRTTCWWWCLGSGNSS